MTDRTPADMGGAFTGVPLCSLDRCPSYDGKRCRETGNEPDRVCLPEVRSQRSEFEHLRSIMRIDRRRLADGVEPMVGQRVVKVRRVAESWHMPHANEDKVHEITSLLGGDTHLVELGFEQVGVAMLQLAPAGAEVTCQSCRGWREQMARLRVDAEVYRREQIGEVHKLRDQLRAALAEIDRLRPVVEAVERWRDADGRTLSDNDVVAVCDAAVERLTGPLNEADRQRHLLCLAVDAMRAQRHAAAGAETEVSNG